jgi:hypothetical protein
MVGISKTEVGDSMDLHLGALGALGFCQPDGSFITTPDDLREVLVEMAGAGEAVVVDADVAVAALTTDGHVGQLYEVTAPGCSAGRRRSPRSPGPAADRSAMCRSPWGITRPC